MVFIEEPENGLYHKYLSDLAAQMKNSIKNTYSKQLFITTHSPFFVNALSPEEVWVLQKQEDGFSTITRASDFEYVKQLCESEVELGDYGTAIILDNMRWIWKNMHTLKF